MNDFFNNQGDTGQPPYQMTISDKTVPYDKSLVDNGINSNKLVLNDNVSWISDGTFSNSEQSELHLSEDAVIHIGDDFEIKAKEFKLMMKVLLKMAKEEYPEEFV